MPFEFIRENKRLPDEVYGMFEATASKSFADRGSCEHGAPSPFLPARGGPMEKRRYSPFTWLNLVCLDAPLVAIAWQLLFARTFGMAAGKSETAALFLTSWLIYLADRFADSVSLDRETVTSARQRFCREHRRAWWVAIVAIAIADLGFCARLEFRTIRFGLAVGACALAYLFVNQVFPFIWRRLPLKETAIGFLFAAGTVVPLSHGLTSEMFPAWFLFGCLCSLNCLSIALWEDRLDAAQCRITITSAFPRISRLLLPLILLLALISPATGMSRINICIAASATLLAVVHLLRGRLEANVRTAFADLVLLTPIWTLLM